MPASNAREVHKRKSLEHRKGKTRLRPLTIKTLQELADREKKGKRYDAYLKEIRRKQKLGVVYKAPEPVVEVEDNA